MYVCIIFGLRGGNPALFFSLSARPLSSRLLYCIVHTAVRYVFRALLCSGEPANPQHNPRESRLPSSPTQGWVSAAGCDSFDPRKYFRLSHLFRSNPNERNVVLLQQPSVLPSMYRVSYRCRSFLLHRCSKRRKLAKRINPVCSTYILLYLVFSN